MTYYVALIHKEKGSDFGVSFPDFPGCVTAGKSMDEARAMAEAALSLHIDGMLEDNSPIPKPSISPAMFQQGEYEDAVAILVPAIIPSQGISESISA